MGRHVSTDFYLGKDQVLFQIFLLLFNKCTFSIFFECCFEFFPGIPYFGYLPVFGHYALPFYRISAFPAQVQFYTILSRINIPNITVINPRMLPILPDNL